MSTDQPEVKKPSEGHIDPKKAVVGEKAPAEKSAAASARESWQAELAKVQHPSSVKVTLAQALSPADHPSVPLKPASASVPADRAAKPGTVIQPGAAPTAKTAHAEVAANPQSAPVKPEATGSVTMSALQWVENKASGAYKAAKNIDYSGMLTEVSKHPSDFTNLGMVKSVYDSVMANDKKGLATMAGVTVLAVVTHRYGGGALAKILKAGAESEVEGSGVAREILGADANAGKGISKPLVKAAANEATSGFESVSARMSDLRGSAALEFGPTKLTTAEGLLPTRIPLRSASVPILDGPLVRTTSHLPRPMSFQVAEPVVSKIPVGLKPVAEPGLKAAAESLPGRVPNFKEFKVGGQRFEPSNSAPEVVHAQAPVHAPEPTHLVEKPALPTRIVEPRVTGPNIEVQSPQRIVEPHVESPTSPREVAAPTGVHVTPREVGAHPDENVRTARSSPPADLHVTPRAVEPPKLVTEPVTNPLLNDRAVPPAVSHVQGTETQAVVRKTEPVIQRSGSFVEPTNSEAEPTALRRDLVHGSEVQPLTAAGQRPIVLSEPGAPHLNREVTANPDANLHHPLTPKSDEIVQVDRPIPTSPEVKLVPPEPLHTGRVETPIPAVSKAPDLRAGESRTAIVEPAPGVSVKSSTETVEPRIAKVEVTPAAVEARPAVADARPAAAEARPAAAEARPAAAEARPAVVEARPVVVEARPVVAEARPVVAEARPAVAEARPVVAEARPAVAETRPAFVEARPVITEARPSVVGARSKVGEPIHTVDSRLAVDEPRTPTIESRTDIAQQRAAVVEPVTAISEPKTSVVVPKSRILDPARIEVPESRIASHEAGLNELLPAENTTPGATNRRLDVTSDAPGKLDRVSNSEIVASETTPTVKRLVESGPPPRLVSERSPNLARTLPVEAPTEVAPLGQRGTAELTANNSRDLALVGDPAAESRIPGKLPESTQTSFEPPKSSPEFTVVKPAAAVEPIGPLEPVGVPEPIRAPEAVRVPEQISKPGFSQTASETSDLRTTSDGTSASANRLAGLPATAPAVELRKAVEQVSTELRTIQQLPGVTEKAANSARELELSLTKMTDVGADTMPAAERVQSMADIRNGFKSLSDEVSTLPGAKQVLSGIENGVTKLRSANDVLLTTALEDATKGVATDIRSSVQELRVADSSISHSINQSLDRLAVPEASAVERRAALDELSTNVERLQPVTEPTQFKALQEKVAEMRASNAKVEIITASQTVENGSTKIGEFAKLARTTLGAEDGAASSALERLEHNTTSLSLSREATSAERQALLTSMESDVRLLKDSPAAAQALPIERELSILRISENSLNLAKSETAFTESSPKFAQAVEESIGQPGITAGDRAELQNLRATAAKLEPSTYKALSEEQQARTLMDAEAQVARLERSTVDASQIRSSFEEVQTSVQDLGQARQAVVADEAALLKTKLEGEAPKFTPPSVDANGSTSSISGEPVVRAKAVEVSPSLQERSLGAAEKPQVEVPGTTTDAAQREAKGLDQPARQPIVESTVLGRERITGEDPLARGETTSLTREGQTFVADKPLSASETIIADRVAPISERQVAPAERISTSEPLRSAAVEGGDAQISGHVSEGVAAERTAAGPVRAVHSESLEERGLASSDHPSDVALSTTPRTIHEPIAVESRVENPLKPASAAELTGESRAIQRSEIVQDASTKVEQSTAALSRSVDKASEINAARGLGGDVALADTNLSAMRRELDDAASAKREPDLALLRARAADLPTEAAGALATRIDGVTQAVANRNELATFERAHKAFESNAQILTAQLNQLNVPGAAATIAELRAGAISLSEASDKIAVLRSMAERLAAISPSLERDTAQSLTSTLEQARQSNVSVNAALVDIINSQVSRVGDVVEAKDALKILNVVVPEGSETSRLVKSAADQLQQVELAHQKATAEFEATRSVFANPSPEQQVTPVSGLLSSARRLFSLQEQATAISEASNPRSFAAVQATLLLAGATFAYTNGSSALGTISAQRDAAESRVKEHATRDVAHLTAADVSSLALATAPVDSAGISNQSTFAPKTDAALSPLVQAAMAQNALRSNITLAQNWEQQNTARGFFAPVFSPDKPQEQPIQTFFAPARKVGLTSSTAPTDVKPRLVYPGFAQRQLNEMAAARRRGGLLSVFADNSTGVRSFGAGLTGATQTSANRIPTGLSRLLNREIISNGLDANGETGNGSQLPTAQPGSPNLSLAATDPDGSGSQPVSASSPASVIVQNRTKSVAV